MVRFLTIFFLTLVTIVLLFITLPAVLQTFNTPSFALGNEPFMWLSWRNEADGAEARFNVLPLALLAFAIGVVSSWLPQRDRLE
ncbi:hypothetical protein IQ273_10010 [Nodosilinea sp. LEGE 07298]|uniref:hypothetical protein n=1 Tax=Nodosilinea sp. LEGE 07298 TaxID=2777970 RepID=UPI00187FE78A|nr:hypothetical protein [Nodosilinea sp. LEGE 07298]MBE9109747.1 hypothetical protein [Nodosilinea sp. LEGE 07298]